MRKIFITLMLVVTYTELNSRQFSVLVERFSERNLMQAIKDVGIKYPDIVLAQAKIETGHFTSKVFKENRNLFGMKLAESRQTTAIGKLNNHAVYMNWKQSIMDYKLWQNRFIGKLHTKKQYLKYLDKYYAENNKYVILIKKMI